METRMFNLGDKVEVKTKDKVWKGHVLESYDSEVVLLKLESGYNIGIREGEILNAKTIKEAEEKEKREFTLEKKKGLRNIAVIVTGGTISSRLDPKTGGVIPTDAEEILNIASGIKEICNIVSVQLPFMKFSENMSFSDWKKLAEICESFLNDESIDGIIITHGTDFLHYTSAALSFFIRDLNKPIALTYSQRSIDRGSSDAALNLLCSARYASSDIAEVALIGHKNSDDEVCLAMPGTKVRKMHTSRRDAFKVINDEPIAEITKDKIKILKEFNAKDKLRKVKIDAKYSDRVALVKVYPGQDPAVLEYYMNQGYKGIILEVAGLGHVPSHQAKFNWLPKIKKLIGDGVVVCATAQTVYGRLNQKVYSAGRELEKTGIVFLGDMLSETAFVKLGWVLGHQNWNKVEKMLENFSGEFNERIVE